jgi:hypothetical protein
MNTSPHKEVIINPGLLSALGYTWATDPMLRAVRSTLISTLTRDSLIFTRGGRRVEVGRAFTTILESSWVAFIEDAVDSAIISGVVPWDIEPHSIEPGIPIVPAISTYDLVVRTDRMKSVCFARENNAGAISNANMATKSSKPRNLPVFAGFGWRPTPDGQPRSPMMAAHALIVHMREMMDIAARGDALAAVPMMVTQQKTGGTHAYDGVEFDMFANADAVELQASDRFRMNSDTVEQVMEQRAVFERFRRGIAENRPELLVQRQAVESRVQYPLPVDHELARQVESHSNPRLQQLLQLHQETLAGCFGVPRSYLMNDQGGRGVASDHSTAVLAATIAWWKRRLSIFLTEVYTAIYGGLDAAAVVQRTLGKRKRFDAASELDSNYVAVEFVSDTTADSEQVTSLFKMGVLTEATYAAVALRSAGLNPALANPDFVSGKLFTPEDRKLMRQAETESVPEPDPEPGADAKKS